jgi:hypothetical protein
MLLFEIPKHRNCYYRDASSIVDEKVRVHLSAVMGDVEEASKCFAVGRYTACVFHLMRVMELSVQQLGKKLKVRLVQEKNWQNIIDEVNKAVKNMPVKTLRRKEIQREYTSIAAHLFNVKVAWRNPVMHPKVSYTEEEAKEIFNNVMIFLSYLVKVL